MKYGFKKFIKNKLQKESFKCHQGLEMIHKSITFFIMPKYLSNSNMKEENLGLWLEKKDVHYNTNGEQFLLKFFKKKKRFILTYQDMI